MLCWREPARALADVSIGIEETLYYIGTLYIDIDYLVTRILGFDIDIRSIDILVLSPL